MKNIFFKYSLLIVVAVFSTAFINPHAQVFSDSDVEPGIELCQIENTVFQAGEELTYELFYNWNFVWLKAGEVTFKVKETGSLYHLSAVGRTYSSYEWFYKVRDYYDCYVDKETLQPVLSIRDVNEGDYKKYDRIQYKFDKQKAISKRGKTSEEATTSSFDLESCVHDILSIVYFSRNIDFENYDEGAKVDVNVFMDRETHPLQVKYLGKEKDVKVKKNGNYDTIVFSPEMVSGRIFKDDNQMKVWVSDDDNRIPVLIESPVSVGSIKAVLNTHKGLKYDLTSAR